MRVVVGSGVGLGVGFLFLIQVLGLAQWCPNGVFGLLHLPGMAIAAELFPGEGGFWGSLPFVPIVQWTFLGTLVGVIMHLNHRPKTPANKSRQPTAAEPRQPTP